MHVCTRSFSVAAAAQDYLFFDSIPCSALVSLACNKKLGIKDLLSAFVFNLATVRLLYRAAAPHQLRSADGPGACPSAATQPGSGATVQVTFAAACCLLGSYFSFDLPPTRPQGCSGQQGRPRKAVEHGTGLRACKPQGGATATNHSVG